MANTGNSIKWDPIREIAAGSLTTSFQPLGGVLTRDSFRIWVTNNTNGDIYITDDGVSNKIKMPSGTARAYDNKTNDEVMRSATQFSVKFASAPGAPAGWVAMEVEYV